MGRTILFSPLGGTDPISLSNYHEGAMLQITRFYHPDKIVLFMSKEILDLQSQDDRYRFCIRKLCESKGWEPIEIEEIARPELENVQEFDYFYPEFRTILSGLCAELDKDDRLLINISSGTPAMKSGLLVVQTLEGYPAEMIQVITPGKGMNEHQHKGYDVELLWELNEDNSENSENRTRIVHCLSLANIQKEQIIKKHIQVFDYQAAIAVAETMPKAACQNYMPLLQIGAERCLLRFKEVDRLVRDSGYDAIPIKSGDSRKNFEYALLLKIRLSRKEYADFIRALTPLIVDLFELILKKRYAFDVENYVSYGSGIRKWSSFKVSQSGELCKMLDEAFSDRGGFAYGPIQSEHLKALIQAYAKAQGDPDNSLVKLVDDLRSVEINIRNLAAHEIIAITDETIKEKTGLKGEKILEKIRVALQYAGIKVSEEAWNSYERMNEEIEKRIV